MITKLCRRSLFFTLAVVLTASGIFAAGRSGDGVWTPVDKTQLRQPGIDSRKLPDAYEAFSLNRSALEALLRSAPEEYTSGRETVLTMPMPDGSFSRFRIEHSLVVEPGLLVNFPELGATYRGHGIDDPTASVRFDLLPGGFHSMVLSTRGTVVVDPYMNGDTDHYISYFKSDRTIPNDFACHFSGDEFNSLTKPKDPGDLEFLSAPTAPEVTSGTQLRTYRLALAADNEYCVAVGGNTVAGSLAAQVLIMNRVNGVYERDLAIHMNIIANNNLIVYAGDNTSCGGSCTGTNDPYSNTAPTTLLNENQSNLDTVIGTANYDIGHVFTTGGGGVATLNAPCNSGAKARGETGLPNPVGDDYAIDFVAHEMGHQFGANHTFNASCGGNRAASAAYEPGSGITVMAYAGVCDGVQELAFHSIDTFHVRSLEEIVAYTQTGSGNTCAVTTSSGNTPPSVTATGPFTIPKQTPFVLTASATDINGDTITYDWEEYDLGAASTTVPNSDATGTRPIFRPYSPATQGKRTFPTLSYILANANVPPATSACAGGTCMTGELLPAITRTMNFQVIARDNHAGAGGINTATSVVNVDATSGPFTVTAPNTGVTVTPGPFSVTWNAAGTAAAPVSAANVNILYSTDGGQTFPTTLAAATPNDGSQSVNIPAGNTTTARVKVEATGNIFFDISDTNFTVSGAAPAVKSRADFDGDGKTDLSVFRPSEGNWYVLASTAGFSALHWGISTDTMVPGDYNGDNKTDYAIFRPSNTAGTADFYILASGGAVTYQDWGLVGDVPVCADYDGDGKTDMAVYRPSTGEWYILKSGGGVTIAPFGQAGDVPVVGDFDGDGKADRVIYRSSSTQWLGQLSGGGPSMNTIFGAAGDLLAPADYDGDNKEDIAVFRPSNGTWYIAAGPGGFTTKAFGTNGDVPVPGDYDGDGKDDIAVYRNGVWYVDRSNGGLFQGAFGLGSDKAVPKAYIP